MDENTGLLAATVVVIVLMLVFTPIACVERNGAKRALEAQGYTQIETGGYAWFWCGRDDAFATKFNAVTAAGVRVNGAVCSGLLKGHTIRTR